MTQVYACTNPTGYGLNAQHKLTVTPGICAGMTAVWCLKMAIGLPQAETKPGLAESTVLQFAYEMHGQRWDSLQSSFMPSARLEMTGDVWQGTGHGTLRSLVEDARGGGTRCYLWGWTGHAIGAAVRDDRFYLFNPDRGLEVFDDGEQLKLHMKSDYAARMKEKGWNLIRVAPDPKQLHLVVPPKR